MKRFMVAALCTFLALGLAAPAQAAWPSKKYSSCKALWKKYPRGIVSSNFIADLVVKDGFLRPQVRLVDYLDNFDNKRLTVDLMGFKIQDLMVCRVAPPEVVPSTPAIASAWASTLELTIKAVWSTPANAGMRVVYDVYLNGTKVNEGLTVTSYEWSNLAPATAYTIGVVARNPAGSSAQATATATTISQEQADHPGQVKVVYTGTGVVDVTLESPTGTQQFDDVTNPSYTFWFSSSKFVYFSVQNQSASGDVSCSISSNGRTVSSNTSSGAYVIATCSGRS
jgi:hypothetical protein